MSSYFFHQPFDHSGQPSRFGDLLTSQLRSGGFEQATLCAAYATSGGTGRVGPDLQSFVGNGGRAFSFLGIANGVTSCQAVTHLLQTGSSVQGFSTGSLSIFHSKVYLLEAPGRAWLATGSCNLTAEGLYGNFESMMVHDLNLSVQSDLMVYRQVHAWLQQLTSYSSNLIPFAPALLAGAVSGRLLIDEAATGPAQQASFARAVSANRAAGIPPIRTKAAPPISAAFARPPRRRAMQSLSVHMTQATGPLVWEKPNLPTSDAQRTGPLANPVGGLRLTQAGYSVNGIAIDQTRYFRYQVFANAAWHPPARPTLMPQEEAFVLFNVRILGTNYGALHLKVAHKPSGAASQGNYTTIIRWGQLRQPLRTIHNIVGTTARLFMPAVPGAPFTLEIA